jgi:hypothetical protein
MTTNLCAAVMLMSLYTNTGWPFDEACATNDTVTSVDATAAAAGISINDVVYAKCEQDSGHDPWLVRTQDWMTSEQATLVSTMFIVIHDAGVIYHSCVNGDISIVLPLLPSIFYAHGSVLL